MPIGWALEGVFEAVDGVDVPGSPLEGLVSYLQVVAIVITLYDHLITFDQEVKYIWSKPSGSIKLNTILYIAARYLGDIIAIIYPLLFMNLFIAPSAYATVPFPEILTLTDLSFFAQMRHGSEIHDCGRGGFGFDIPGQVLFYSGHMDINSITVIMQLRIKSLYHSGTVSNAISALWALEIICVGVVSSFTLGSLHAQPFGPSGAELCTVVRVPRLMALFWIPVLVFDAVLFYMSIRVGMYNRRQYGHWGGEQAFVGKLLSVLLQDNCIYFILGFFSYLITIIILLTLGPRYFLIPTIIGSAVNTNASCRFVLNLYGAYHHPGGAHSLDDDVWSMEGIRFARFSADRTTRPSTGSHRRNTIVH
ncbi:hypothetical protein CPB83DRAFT_889375 [Crepidotus variabilis]|uniref:DUF6533 domain-containing protein n=1 Tax=Crepidotus variabilis TaxID=179855 RepID=A0A9P6ET79_9AGAR|nr:hypothetical protein CPB83DRAFT_889375 [Crepidotus variabilis]